ncbi:Zn-dependent protease (includes SpoIVFB) [Raineyella antarctica]|uniref:Zinc metalloprotease n=1 Tax=Raineyella antarctica TaxID=1577474 RepID=A0A1G6HQV8_9ACTN|nr:site-2 protease family protein [Raineyella antarctica]SDB96622.1 Zn-dependent protease (includes SpoIVFB) [Raineyella antarctica]
MGGEIRVGRIAGIDIKLHWSLLVIFALITWSLATGGFSGVQSSGTTAEWVAALIASVLFFGALLAHEIGHALVARRKGLEIQDITLWVFGGVSRLKGEAHTAADEFRIAVVGPVVSFGAAAIFAGLAFVLGALGAPALAVAVPTWLALINVVLAVFNMLPAFPLDGGRVLRAWLWKRRGDRTAATRTAAAVGRAFGFVLIGVGVFWFMTGNTINGLWFVVLGWFLFGAARAEESQSQLSRALHDVRVRHVMTPQPAVLPASMGVTDYIDHAMASRFTSFPVVDPTGRVVGLVTMRRVRAAMARGEEGSTLAHVALPIEQVPVLSPEDSATSLLEKLQGAPDGRALVFDRGALVGIVCPTDLQRMLELTTLRSDTGGRRT